VHEACFETDPVSLFVIAEPVWKARVCFPVGCCGHAVLDCAWLTGQCEFVLSLCVISLQVREVIVV
jgi:hypothetical protein